MEKYPEDIDWEWLNLSFPFLLAILYYPLLEILPGYYRMTGDEALEAVLPKSRN